MSPRWPVLDGVVLENLEVVATQPESAGVLAAVTMTQVPTMPGPTPIRPRVRCSNQHGQVDEGCYNGLACLRGTQR